MQKLIQVTTTFGKKEEAEKATDMILKKLLSPCIQLFGPVDSSYWWEGRVEKKAEFMLFIKTTAKNFNKVQNVIKEINSYELPEIIATPITFGDDEYLDWLEKNTK